MWYQTGTVTTVNGSASVVGVGTAWLGQVSAGDLFTVDRVSFYKVAAVGGDGRLTLTTAYAGSSAVDQIYGIVLGGEAAASGLLSAAATLLTPDDRLTAVFGRSGAVIAQAGDYTAAQVEVMPGGGISATEVQGALAELDAGKAALLSPVFTGSPAGPTPEHGDNSTRLATTAFVKAQGFITAAEAPVQSVAGKTGVVTLVVGDVSGAAPLASPALTGTPTAPTPAASDNSTTLATTAFVKAQTLNDLGAPTAALSLDGQRLVNVADPTGDRDAATKAYVDSVAQGLDAKASVRAATTADIVLSGPQTVDGVALGAGDRVLVKNQANPAENGICVAAAGAWGRSADANSWDELVSAYVFVEGGTVNADAGFTCTVQPGGTLGTTPVTWVQFSGAGQVVAGTGLLKDGNTLSVDTSVIAALASPAFSGTPTAPTPTVGDNSTLLATTAFVQATVATETSRGLIEIATDAEVIALTDAARAITPKGLSAAIAAGVVGAAVVQRPVNQQPGAGATGVEQSAPFVGSAYAALYGIPQGGARFQVSTVGDFSTLIYDSGTVGPVTSLVIASGVLAVSSSYHWRLRYENAQGDWSPWSSPTGFTTASVFIAIATPAILTPASGAAGIGTTPVITATSFSVTAGSDTPASAQYQVALDSGFTSIVADSGQIDYTTSWTVPAGSALANSTPYFARVSYKGASGIYSAWSPASGFTTQAAAGAACYLAPGTHSFTVPAAVYSVCVVCVGGGANGTSVLSSPTGGGGGGLAWKNGISVAPGQTISVVVGGAGQTSSFGSAVSATGGNGSAGGYPVGADGGGTGGAGGQPAPLPAGGGKPGGGGAGGYAGAGGAGGNADAYTPGQAGSADSGAAGGGQGLPSSYTNNTCGGGGGGVGLMGIGATGAGGSGEFGCETSIGAPGGGGSGGTAGSISNPYSYGGSYGGGGGSGSWPSAGCSGAVRVIWGEGRSFPSNAG